MVAWSCLQMALSWLWFRALFDKVVWYLRRERYQGGGCAYAGLPGSAMLLERLVHTIQGRRSKEIILCNALNSSAGHGERKR